MAFTAGSRKKIGPCVQQRGQRIPVTAKPGEEHHLQQQESSSRGQGRFGLPQTGRGLSAQIPPPEDECGAGQREEMKNSGLLACEHHRGAGAGQRGMPGGVPLTSAPTGQNQSKRGGGKDGLMNEVSIVVNGQGSAGKQQRGDQAGHEAKHFDRRAKQEDRNTSGENICQAQFRFCEVGKHLCTLHFGNRQGECG